MSKIIWDADGQHLYETGVDHGVLYPRNDAGEYVGGVPWNGLTGVTESPSGAEATDLYADNIKYLSIRSAEEFGATVTAYTYPDEFAECDGSVSIVRGLTIGQQARKSFGMSYRTIVGNDVKLNDYGYKLHLIYGCTASPSERAYSTVNDSPEAIEFSWELETTPVSVEGYKNTATLTIDSTMFSKTVMDAIEAVLYGDDTHEARLPLPNEVIDIISKADPALSYAENVTADPPGTHRYENIDISKLQENVTIKNNVVSGHLKYVNDETMANVFPEDEKTGNFLSIALPASAGATIKTKVEGGKKDWVEVADGFCIYRIADSKKQKILIQVQKDNATGELSYALTGLNCDSAPV